VSSLALHHLSFYVHNFQTMTIIHMNDMINPSPTLIVGRRQ